MRSKSFASFTAGFAASPGFAAAVLGGTLLAALPAAAQVSTQRVEGLRDNTPRLHALTGARLVFAPGQSVDNGTLVLRDGVIVAAGAGVAVPAGARVWKLEGRTVYAGFIDLAGALGVPAALRPPPSPASSSPAARRTGPPPPRPTLPARALASDNPRVHPEQDVAQQLDVSPDDTKKWRELGFTTVLAAPSAGVFRGQSALVDLGGGGDAKALVVAPRAAQHVAAEFDRGENAATYPNSLMGAIALVRQTLYDARWYRNALAFAARRGGPAAERPAPNASLAALEPVLEGRQPVVFQADEEQAYARIARLRDEFGLRVVVQGNGFEYRRAGDLAAARLPVIVPLAYPAPPEIDNPDTALDTPLDTLQHWEQAPSNLALIDRAGVEFAVTAAGLANPGRDFWPRLRQAVKRGLPADKALAGLTTVAARLVGEQARLGTLAPGRIANVVVARGDLFADDKAVVELAFVDGRPYPAPAMERFDARGDWQVDAPGGAPGGWRIEGTPERPVMKLGGALCSLTQRGRELVLRLPCNAVATAIAAPGAAASGAGVAAGTANGSAAAPAASPGTASAAVTAAATTTAAAGATARVALPPPVEPANPVVIVAEGRDDTLRGTVQTGDGTLKPWSARRVAPFDTATATPPDAPPPETPPPAPPTTYPAGAFGIEPPPRPVVLLVRNATVWTSAAAGRLEHADLLVRDGKIAAVGTGLAAPAGSVVIDATGKHVTPGIVDAHSHTAILEGVNEASSSITAEVRIGDVLDATDVNLYRELAGGVTTANVLHGSANTIGGQNQVIKLRWGAHAEALKFEGAMPGIKFALGENVKQSNWGDRFTTRYPQTRMGVEQILVDAFAAARAYAAERAAWARAPNERAEPRRDLQLDALQEVVERRRVIHIHSYRQDELLMFARLAQREGIDVATFQHVLEGYKVADVIAKLGAGGSTFSDWWAYKMEVIDAIPDNGAIMNAAGVLTSFNSDSDELARRLNTEAAKAVKYGGVAETEALKFVTLNPARQLRIDARTGSLEPGKDADFVIWSASPLSTFARAEQTWIDGRRYFDLQTDAALRDAAARERRRLVARALPARLAALAGGDKPGAAQPAPNAAAVDDESDADDALELQQALAHAATHRGSYRGGASAHACTEGEQ